MEQEAPRTELAQSLLAAHLEKFPSNVLLWKMYAVLHQYIVITLNPLGLCQLKRISNVLGRYGGCTSRLLMCCPSVYHCGLT